jgi:hypothetical protein
MNVPFLGFCVSKQYVSHSGYTLDRMSNSHFVWTNDLIFDLLQALGRLRPTGSSSLSFHILSSSRC